MSAVWLWIRLDLRSRKRSLLVMALLVALTTGVVLTAVAGARRGSTAVDRLLDRTMPATVAALPNERGFDWEAVEELPNVAAIARFPVSQWYIKDLPPGGGQLRLRRRGDDRHRAPRGARGAARRPVARRRGRHHRGLRGHDRQGGGRHRHHPAPHARTGRRDLPLRRGAAARGTGDRDHDRGRRAVPVVLRLRRRSARQPDPVERPVRPARGQPHRQHRGRQHQRPRAARWGSRRSAGLPGGSGRADGPA